jgi:hypothetical protein
MQLRRKRACFLGTKDSQSIPIVSALHQISYAGGTYLPTPAIPNNRPLLNPPTLPQLLHNFRDPRYRLGRRSLVIKELTKLLLVFVRLRRVPRDVGRLALEEIRHEDLVRVVGVGVGEDVGALQRLVEEAEDIVDDEDALLCVFGAGGVWGSGLAYTCGGLRGWLYMSLGRRLGYSRLWGSSPC